MRLFQRKAMQRPRSCFPLLSILMATILLAAAPGRCATPPSNRPYTAGIKLTITKSGIYRITGTDLSTAGFALNTVNPGNIRLFCADAEIPFHQVDAVGQTLGADDAIIFYGESYSDIYTRQNVYWIYINSESGNQMKSIDTTPESQPDPATTFTSTLTIEQNHEMWTETPGAPEADFWFWQRMSPQGTSKISFSFDLPYPAGSGNAALSFFFQGRSFGSHSALIKINDIDLKSEQWSGTAAVVAQMSVPQADLYQQFANNITLSALQNSIPDSFYFNKLSVSYKRNLIADNNRLLFTIDANKGPVKVSGFTGADIMVLDVTDPKNPAILNNTVISDSSPYTVLFQHPGGKHDYVAQTVSAMFSPDSLKLTPASGLANPANSADYIVITARDLIPATARLLELRHLQGFSPMAVSVEDIYNTFSGGRFTPQAIADFINYAYHNWQTPKLKYVLLAGDADIDFLDNYKTGKKNIVPPFLVDTPELGLTPSDNPYACVKGGDAVPDIMIGRIPGNNTDDIQKITDKLIFYETDTGPGPKKALFVADNDSPSFEIASNGLIPYLPPDFSAQKVYASTYSSFDSVTNDIISALDTGMLITNYVGHGDMFRWGVEPFGGGDFMLTPDDLSRLSGSGTPTFVISLDCLNGYFAQVERYCLAEEWLLADGGAIGCFAPSGLGYEWDYTRLNNAVFSGIFDNYENRLGAITNNAKINAYFAGSSADILNSFQLIGDPATRLDIYRNPDDRIAVFAVKAEASTGGSISPAGKIPAFKGDDIAFSISAHFGYDISDVLVDGESKGPVSTITLPNVDADHFVSASFKSNQPEPGGGGGGGGGCFIWTIAR